MTTSDDKAEQNMLQVLAAARSFLLLIIKEWVCGNHMSRFSQGLCEEQPSPVSSERTAKREGTAPESCAQWGQGQGEGLSRWLEEVEEKCAKAERNSGNENPGKGSGSRCAWEPRFPPHGLLQQRISPGPCTLSACWWITLHLDSSSTEGWRENSELLGLY